jgi:hypothetical protein
MKRPTGCQPNLENPENTILAAGVLPKTKFGALIVKLEIVCLMSALSTNFGILRTACAKHAAIAH